VGCCAEHPCRRPIDARCLEEGRDERDGAGFDPAPRSDLGKPYPIIRSVFALGPKSSDRLTS